MANTVDIQKIIDGPRNAVIKIFLASDGASGELADQIIVDVSTLEGAPSKVHLMAIDWCLRGFDVLLEWEATTDAPIITLTPESGAGGFCWEKFGGIPNNGGAGVTGDLSITTTGFTAAGDNGFLLLSVTKD